MLGLASEPGGGFHITLVFRVILNDSLCVSSSPSPVRIFCVSQVVLCFDTSTRNNHESFHGRALKRHYVSRLSAESEMRAERALARGRQRPVESSGRGRERERARARSNLTQTLAERERTAVGEFRLLLSNGTPARETPASVH